MCKLQQLCGLSISSVEGLHDYVQIVFSDSSILSIFNNYDCDAESVFKLQGKKIASVIESADSITIVLSGQHKLKISLSVDDFNGPEALTFSRRGQPTVVWN